MRENKYLADKSVHDLCPVALFAVFLSSDIFGGIVNGNKGYAA